MSFRVSAAATVVFVVLAGPVGAEVHSLNRSDLRDEFMHQCVPHTAGRWTHPEMVCGCLYDRAVARVEDNDLRQAVLRGISETGVPTIETDWVPPSKRSEIGATFTKIAKPTLQCMFAPSS